MSLNYRAGAFGVAGLEISSEEAKFFSAYKPLGLILFQRNCYSQEQVRQLTNRFRKLVGRENAPVMIDEEGGKVQRMKDQPYWSNLPAFSSLGKLYEEHPEKGECALKFQVCEISRRLKDCGINMVCSPVLDLYREGTTDVIGSRAFSENCETVATLGKLVVDEFLSRGIVPVIKHIPGHGRAVFDSHKTVSEIDTDLSDLETSDFLPFQKLKDVPVAMTAHLIFKHLDPKNPVTVSKSALNFIRTKLRFSGVLISDCLWMDALPGSHLERIDNTFFAGIDWGLYCHGTPEQMCAVAERMPFVDLNRAPFARLVSLLQ